MGVYDSMLVKYGAVMVAFFVLGIPVFGSNKEDYLKSIGNDTSSITRDYIRNSGLMINLSKAIGRIVVSYKEVQNLAGYTTLVYEMKEVLGDLKKGVYARIKANQDQETRIKGENQDDEMHALVAGELQEDESIRMMDVPLTAPNGDVLANPLRIMLKQGKNCLFVGPNGSGKSSLYRILGGLWPLQGGKLYRPSKSEMFFLPQKPYLPPGTLRDQITYPDLQSNMSDEVGVRWD